MKISFTKEEKIECAKKAKNGVTQGKLGQKFGCSYSTIGRLLIKILGLEIAKKITKEHRSKQAQKMHQLSRTEKQLENAQKMGKLPKTEKQRKNWVSSWEDKFYDEYLEPIFGYDLQRQYYIKEINHRFDFAILDSRVLIEIDGDYWHQFHEERDAQIDEWAKQNNWKLYRYNNKNMKKLGII